MLYNEELHKMYEATKHLNDVPENEGEPEAKLHGSVWHDKRTNDLKWFDKASGQWRRYYENEFKITENIMNSLPPANPVPGQLWLNHGILTFFDGATWHPVKADVQDGSQYSLDVFQNFLLMSPMVTTGNAVVTDDDVAEYKKGERQYLQGVLDAKTDSNITGDGTKWYPWKKTTINAPSLPVFQENLKCQLIVPHLSCARIFLDHQLTNIYEKVNECCIQFKRKDIYNHTPSLVHINPSRLSNIKKRLIKIDRANPKIAVPPANTEYYGFRLGEHFGDFLCPDYKDGDGDYTIQADGILLSYNASQDYDYILAVTYEFLWLKSSGKATSFDYNEKKTHYYVENYAGPNSVFVEGYNLEDPYYTENGATKMIHLKQDTNELSLSLMHAPKREYGYVRQLDSQNRGIVKPIQHFEIDDTLVFINGQALSTAYDGVVFDDGNIYVPGAKEGMMWSVLSLTDGDYKAKMLTGITENDDVIPYAADKDHTIQIWETDEDGNIAYQKDSQGDYVYQRDKRGHILYEKDKNGEYIPEKDEDGNPMYEKGEDGKNLLDSKGNPIPVRIPKKIRTLRIILFIDGLLVRNEDIVVDEETKTLYVKGLHENQEYILIEDKKHWLYSDGKVSPAIPTGVLSESLVYYNDKLIANGACVDTEKNPEAVKGVFNEVKYFIKRETKSIPKLNAKGEPVKDANGDPIVEIQSKIVSKQFRVYDPKTGHWNLVHEDYEGPLEVMTHSYENTPGGIRLNMGYNDSDKVKIFAYHYANDIDNPIQVFNQLVEDEDLIKTKAAYLPNTHSLKVWLNGVRQYPKLTEDSYGIKEDISGNYFRLPHKFTGLVTYIIELPETGKQTACDLEILDERNILPGYVNMYHTDIPLYPGRCEMFVNGLRLPKESFTLLDNHTFIINDDTQLIGAANNFPEESVIYGDAQHKYIDHAKADQILVEVRQDNRREATIRMTNHDTSEIDLKKYGLSPAILEPADEVMIYLNGLYFGPRMNEGYQLLESRNSLLITNACMKDVMGSDIRVAIAKNEVELQDYFIPHGRKLYPQADNVLTFEWR